VQPSVAMHERKIEGSQQAGVLGEVVSLYAEELGKFGQHRPARILDEHTKTGWAGVAARAAVAVGGDPFGSRWFRGWCGKEAGLGRA